MRNATLAVVALMLCSLAAAPVAAMTTAPPEVAETPTATPNGTETANNSTATEAPPTNASGEPTLASQVRITPVKFDEPFVGVSVRESDSVFETTGPFAVFSLSSEVEAARISQQPATAQVLAGGTQVKVSYADDAAPPGETSLYTLELFFADGSSKTVDLYARKTGVSVAASELKEYEDVIEELRGLTKEHGYGDSPEEMLAYLEWVNERADLIDGFLTKSAAQLMALGIAAARNWLFWLLTLAGIALVAKWIQKRYGGLLEALQNDVGRAERKRRELELAYQESKQTADEMALEEVPAVGANAVYWRDGHGVRSAGQLARLAAYGAHRQTEDGLEQVHDGVADLDKDSLETSWLEPVLRGNRIPTAKQALGEVKATLEYMETKHNLGHLYRNARDEVAQLIEEIEEEEQMTFGPGNASRGDD
jgi:hypothetical protein